MDSKKTLGLALGGLAIIGLPALIGWPTQTPSLSLLGGSREPTARSLDASAIRNSSSGAASVPRTISKTLKLKKGDTLFGLLMDAGAIRDDANAAVAALADVRSPRQLEAGQEVQVLFDTAANVDSRTTLARLIIPVAFGEDVIVANSGQGFSARIAKADFTQIKSYAEGVIDDSLYLAAERQGVPAPVIAELIRLFSFDVDFQRDVWAGDSFQLYYERSLTRDGDAEPNGRIVAASLKLRGKELAYFRHLDSEGNVEYYTAEGQSARKMLMKTPIDGARLSSRYGMRKHPILGYNRMHKGMDFAAPTGTPIYAAGNGVVEKASVVGSYGKYILIRHNSTYSTAYGHLSRYAKGIGTGSRVRQGQIIGYVGATGGATGPHLHYEVLVRGAQVNPSSLRYPKDKDLAGEELASFRLTVTGNERELEAIQSLRQQAASGKAVAASSASMP